MTRQEDLGGFSYGQSSNRCEDFVTAAPLPDDGGRIIFGWAHGGDSSHIPINQEEAAPGRDLDYIALGIVSNRGID